MKQKENPADTKHIAIPAIENGTVIDHVPSRETFKIMKLLELNEFIHPITIALNLESKRIGKKGMIKINDRVLSEEEVNKVAILAPQATVNIIKDYKVREKILVRVPNLIEKIVKCSNPNCITNIEDVKTRFELVAENPLKLRCAYCERTIGRDDIKLN